MTVTCTIYVKVDEVFDLYTNEAAYLYIWA